MKKIIVLIASFWMCILFGCQKPGASKYVRLSIPGDSQYGSSIYDSTSINYRTYKWFDLQKLEGVGEADSEPFVYVRTQNQKIIVRPSNDLNNPYILTNHGLYWHCTWEGYGRGDSIKIDRFVINKFVYEYIQKKCKDGKIQRMLISTDTFQHNFSDQKYMEEIIYGLGRTDEFDPNPEDHFLDIIEEINGSSFNETIDESVDSLQEYWRCTIGLTIYPPKSKNTKYREDKNEKKYYYDEAPFGLYDEYYDTHRPYFMRRIK